MNVRYPPPFSLQDMFLKTQPTPIQQYQHCEKNVHEQKVLVKNIRSFDQCHPLVELKRKRAHKCTTVSLILNLTCNGIANLQYLLDLTRYD